MEGRDPLLRIDVETYAGYRADESPRAFSLGARRVVVAEELDRWLDPEHRYFKLRGDDRGIYILLYSASEDSWEMILFDSGTVGDPRISLT